MKFGKRFSQAQGNSQQEYLNYKALKQALKFDCTCSDTLGTRFEQTLQRELVKVSSVYLDEAARLHALLQELSNAEPSRVLPGLAVLRKHLQELTKYAALNYVAVLKAVKKRNRRLMDACGDQVVTVAPFSVLQNQAFFTAAELQQIGSAAMALDPVAHEGEPNAMECPTCLQLIQGPVVLSCMHTFCWGCITMYCLGVFHSKRDASPGEGQPKAGASNAVAPSSMSQLTQGWAPVPVDDGICEGALVQQDAHFRCPVCQRKQSLDLDSLTVDATLATFVKPRKPLTRHNAVTDSMEASSSSGVATPQQTLSVQSDDDSLWSKPRALSPLASPMNASPSTQSEETVLQASSKMLPLLAEALLPPQDLKWCGKLSIVLDIDGTLIASFPPRRAPKLPSHMRTHVVGAGSSLNPQGVFVVERPGLQEFLQAVSSFCELSVFTAGLPEYAQPILAAIDPSGEFFGNRVVCRSGTSVAPEYPCVKDLSRLGRNLSRTLIVDDTPLAFLWQPANGVPVLGFRGDPYDNLLLDAVLPLIQLAAEESDVRPFLNSRFGMATWFRSHSYTPHPPEEDPTAPAMSAELCPSADSGSAGTDSAKLALARATVASEVAQRAPAGMPLNGPLLLCDFDQTLIDCDVTERVTEQLAIELVPFLVHFQAPGDFVPIMNSMLRELAMRGVSHAALLRALTGLGAEFPRQSVDMLRAARKAGAAIRVLSNCNSLFVEMVLEGAKLEGVVHDVISHKARSVVAGDSWHVQIDPLQSGVTAPHCPLCPPTMCKGMYVDALRVQHSRIVFCCDGANDLCAVLRLAQGDVALVRELHGCHRLLKERARAGLQQPNCSVLHWKDHAELRALVNKHLRI